MVTHIVWDDAYKVGHEMIDSQHRRLFELADVLFCLLGTDAEQDRNHVEAVILDCAEYVLFHFSNEERLMGEIGYDQAEHHFKLHHDFNGYISELIGDFTDGKDIDLGKLYSYIANWLVQHIITEDKKLAEYIATSQQMV